MKRRFALVAPTSAPAAPLAPIDNAAAALALFQPVEGCFADGISVDLDLRHGGARALATTKNRPVTPSFGGRRGLRSDFESNRGENTKSDLDVVRRGESLASLNPEIADRMRQRARSLEGKAAEAE